MQCMNVMISVIPLAHSYGTEPLTYLCGADFRKQIQIGSLVEIPLGKKLEYGIVASIESDHTDDIPDTVKSLSLVICSRPLLAPYQIEAISSLSEYLFEPIHKIALLFLPKSLLRFFEKHSFSWLEDFPPTKKKKLSDRDIYFIRSGRVSASIIEKYIEKKRTAIIFPDMFLTSHFLRYTTLPSASLFLLEESLTPRTRIQRWKDIEGWKYPIVVGTRKLLWYNLRSYEKILYIEDAFSDTYFHFPLRIRYLDILRHFWHFWPSVTILSSVPSIYALTGLHEFKKHVSE